MKGLYEWLIMTLGLCNSSAKFMCLLNDMLCTFLDSFVIFYLNDILVYSATLEEHVPHRRQLLETLKRHKLLANLKKCDFI